MLFWDYNLYIQNHTFLGMPVGKKIIMKGTGLPEICINALTDELLEVQTYDSNGSIQED